MCYKMMMTQVVRTRMRSPSLNMQASMKFIQIEMHHVKQNIDQTSVNDNDDENNNTSIYNMLVVAIHTTAEHTITQRSQHDHNYNRHRQHPLGIPQSKMTYISKIGNDDYFNKVMIILKSMKQSGMQQQLIHHNQHNPILTD